MSRLFIRWGGIEKCLRQMQVKCDRKKHFIKYGHGALNQDGGFEGVGAPLGSESKDSGRLTFDHFDLIHFE